MPRLRRELLEDELIHAAARLDLEGLGRALSTTAGAPPPALEAAIKRCAEQATRRRDTCAAARVLARAAGPWQAEERVPQLAARLQDPDPLESWKALASLAQSPEPEAGQQIADQLSSARLDTLWAADRALRTWLAARPAPARVRWLRQLSRRTPHRANHDEVQRHAYLAVLLDQARALDEQGRPASSAARRRLESLMHDPPRALAASFLLWRRYGPVRRVVAKLVAAASARLSWLRGAFPRRIDGESTAPALLAERELFALTEVLGGLGAEAGAQRRDALQLLGGWRRRLHKASPTFQPGIVVDFAEAVRTHERGRLAAWTTLSRRADPASRVAATAICMLDRPAGRTIPVAAVAADSSAGADGSAGVGRELQAACAAYLARRALWASQLLRSRDPQPR